MHDIMYHITNDGIAYKRIPSKAKLDSPLLRSAIPTPQLLDSVPRFRHHRSTFRALKALDTFRVIGGRISLLSLPCPLTAPSLVCTSAIEGFGEYEYSEEAMYVARYNN